MRRQSISGRCRTGIGISLVVVLSRHAVARVIVARKRLRPNLPHRRLRVVGLWRALTSFSAQPSRMSPIASRPSLDSHETWIAKCRG